MRHPEIHRAGAKVYFESRRAVSGILTGEVKAGDVVVIRYEGPKGGPGMQEMLYPTSYLKSKGLSKTCALLTGRTDSGGTSASRSVTPRRKRPRAARSVWWRPGDRIEIDIPLDPPGPSWTPNSNAAARRWRRRAIADAAAAAAQPALQAYAAMTTSARAVRDEPAPGQGAPDGARLGEEPAQPGSGTAPGAGSKVERLALAQLRPIWPPRPYRNTSPHWAVTQRVVVADDRRGVVGHHRAGQQRRRAEAAIHQNENRSGNPSRDGSMQWDGQLRISSARRQTQAPRPMSTETTRPAFRSGLDVLLLLQPFDPGAVGIDRDRCRLADLRSHDRAAAIPDSDARLQMPPSMAASAGVIAIGSRPCACPFYRIAARGRPGAVDGAWFPDRRSAVSASARAVASAGSFRRGQCTASRWAWLPPPTASFGSAGTMGQRALPVAAPRRRVSPAGRPRA